MKVVTETRRVR